MIRRANNVFSVILSDVDQVSSALPAVGTVVTDANLAKGAVVLTDVGLRRMSNTEYSALSAGDQFFIVQGKGTGKHLQKSPVLTVGKTKMTINKHKPAVQQITVIGSNGTTGSLPTSNDTSFFIKIRKNDNDAANRSQPTSLFAQFKSDLSGTQYELAEGLINNGNKNMADEPANGYLVFDMIIDTAATNTALGGLTNPTGNLVVTKGSKVVTMTDTQDLSAGDYIRFTGAATETITDSVYRIASVDSATKITLVNAYTGASSSAYDDDFAHLIPKATGDADNFGVRLTGIAAPFDVNKFRDYYANRFTAIFSDDSVLVTHVQGAYNGNGVWQQVAMDEYMSYGYEGQNEMLGVPPTARDQEVKIPGVGSITSLTAKYSTLNIAWTEDLSGLVTNAGGKGSVLVHLNLANNSGSGILATGTDNTGETLVVALGLTASNFNE